MSRPIEFRAWDKYAKVMITEMTSVGFYDTDCGRQLVREAYMVGGGERYPMSNYELLQYTGINDNKRTKKYPRGQKIFEGDIVNTYEYDGYSDNPVRIYHNHIVEWHDTMAGFGISTLPKRALEDGWRNEYKVIGNIYENPELLT